MDFKLIWYKFKMLKILWLFWLLGYFHRCLIHILLSDHVSEMAQNHNSTNRSTEEAEVSQVCNQKLENQNNNYVYINYVYINTDGNIWEQTKNVTKDTASKVMYHLSMGCTILGETFFFYCFFVGLVQKCYILMTIT